MNSTEFLKMTDAEAIIWVAPLFQKNAKETGILASVLLGQFIYESDTGKSKLAQMSNNLFGMKTHLSNNTWKGSVWDGGSVSLLSTEMDNTGKLYQIEQNYRKYKSIEDSIYDHGMYLLNAKNGQQLRYEKIANANPFEAARIIQNGGYSTFKNYEKTLIRIIKIWGLQRFD